MNQPVDMVTGQGHAIYFSNPERTTIDLLDLRRSTMNICRYNGHLNWKLVQHLWLCVQLAKANYTLNPLASLYAGAHDLHEVYVADIVSGMKPHLTNYRRIEYSWEVYVHESLGLPWSLRPHEEVKYVDMRALVLEMNVLRHPSAKEVASQLGGEPSGEELQIMMDVRALSVSDCWDLLWAEICQGIQYIKEVRNGKGKSNSQERESRSS